MEKADYQQENGKKEKRYVSLKVKWSIGTGLGVLLIFAVFFVLLYQSFSNLLLQQEESYAHSALNTATTRLANFDSELTQDDVKNALNYDFSIRTKKDTNTDSVFATLSRKYIGISVYNLSGDLLFASRDVPQKLKKQIASQNELTQIGKASVFVASKEIRSAMTHQVIGYVQVINHLRDYDNTRNKLLLIFVVFGITAGFAVALLSYALSSWLLKPIDAINDTIDKINNDEEGEALARVRVPKTTANDELTELSDLFNAMLDRMGQYVEHQQQFVEDVSHELRTPVAIIQGHLSMLNRWGKDDPEVLDDSIKASLQEINRMKSLVQEMLDLSRAEQVEIQFAQEVTDAYEIGLQVFGNFKMIHPEFTFLLDDDLHKPTLAKIHHNHLEQVLIILLDNAVKYSCERKEIHLAMSKNSRFLEILVQDFGEGISKEDLNKVFKRFYRVDKSRSRNKGGNGLGLAIANRLVEGYHGSLTVESVLGQGSIFKISIPLVIEDKNK